MNGIAPRIGNAVSDRETSPETPPEASSQTSSDKAFPCFRRAGPFVFVSATGVAPGAAGPRGIREQTSICIEQIREILADAGGGLENLVDVTTYLVSMNDFGGYNDSYSNHFTPDGPARTTVAVQRLSHPDALIEIRGTAYIVGNAAPSKTTVTEDLKWPRAKS